jgi:hypothetical protein
MWPLVFCLSVPLLSQVVVVYISGNLRSRKGNFTDVSFRFNESKVMDMSKAKAVFLVMCNPSMNEL